ncbi:DUF1837 domain-containing protein [Acidithiobacillus ferrooxidans]|uniref:HamA C-terminal domain-containing protein n=1 Tax=Acidithiobacillus ferrooxidans TaxID=920 RepID=UPI00214A9D54|nr:DUF1837 domain-containing protein [Acidithiobacillus ferrooxidans]MCR2828995.1 DUF1837 domain-containing protein [Acidithiobacillus ferrooxidans]
MDFSIIINSSLLDIQIASDLSPRDNKTLLSLVNDFEDTRWRSEKFIDFVWDNIAETALSFKERDALQAQPASLLRNAAKNLRLTDSDKDIGKGSELAEIVLYGLMRHIYGALPVVPKIFYKQNTQDNAKGADSVHILLDDKDGFSLWFGEAKFYSSIEDARLDSIVASVKASLSTGKLKKENAIITNVSDIDLLEIDSDVRNRIKSAISNKASIDTIKPLINVPILILHECEITAAASELSNSYNESIREYHTQRAVAYFKKQLVSIGEMHKYGAIKFHLLLFPVPVKKPIVDLFVTGVRYYKGDS